jgi:transcription antitermination factor NusA-like protein
METAAGAGGHEALGRKTLRLTDQKISYLIGYGGENIKLLRDILGVTFILDSPFSRDAVRKSK